ncbi:MAG: leucine-rich repeat domain-containing protein [Anaerolineae bacterium]|nr:leucine-rich repeat domain-containing protein [Anaerolineae bacterium]
MNKRKLLDIIKRANEEQWERLDLSNSQLSEIPPDIGQLSHLLSLVLYNNHLTELPPEIGQLPNLSTLYLGNNQLIGLPPEIGHLSKLSTLDVSNNHLTKFPAEIGRLTNLSSLVAYNNRLTEITSEIGHLAHLTMFNLSNNHLAKLPLSIRQLAKLALFNLSNNQLAKLLPEIGLLSNLSVLDLSNNQLEDIPPEIGNLAGLLSLVLHNNGLTVVPSEIGRLTRLFSLDLSNNQLTTLPKQINQLTRLASFDVSNNQLTELPLEIGRLTNLSKFYLKRNNVSTLPLEIGALTKLKTFDLSDNKLAELPPTIGRLTNLSKFYLSRNRLTELPVEINQLSHLDFFDVKHNPQLPIPPEIVGQSNNPATLIHYYLEYRSSVEHKPLNEAKILLVGQSYVGKTSLVRRLVKNDFNPNEAKTEGIDIHNWNVGVNGQDIRLNVWDFGGQEIMHATHQFFLTQRSLYLLVLNARQDEHDNRIEYWLKIIQSFGGNSSVIVVINKCDQEKLHHVDRRGLEIKYPHIKNFVFTSCKTGEGIEHLKALIIAELERLDHVRDSLPAQWIYLKNKLEKLELDYISYTEYKTLCVKQGITDEQSQKIIVGFLHDLGVMLNFHKASSLFDTYILNPEWVTGGVYRILNYNALFHAKGVLDAKMLATILESPRYPRETHHFIIDIMRKFELCFAFEQATASFLIPDMLPKEEPYTGEWDARSCLGFQYHYNVLPSSVMSRFIVRMHQSIYQKTYWRNGVVVQRGKNKALVKADPEERKISIIINGWAQTRREFLAIIRDQFDHIHQTISKLEAKEKIPLPDYPTIVTDFQHLLTLEEMGKSTFIPEGIDVEINVKQLLNGIEHQNERQERRSNNYEQKKQQKRSSLPPPVLSQSVDIDELLEEMIKAKTYLDQTAQRHVHEILWLLGGGVVLLWALGWTAIYQVGQKFLQSTYFVCFLTPVALYLTIILTRINLMPSPIYEWLIKTRISKNYADFGFNQKKYNQYLSTLQNNSKSLRLRLQSDKASYQTLTKDLQNLVHIKSRRLQKLREQHARQGINTPADILIEIEDLESEIKRLKLQSNKHT